MLENRSFDSMLGMLYPKSDQFNGLSGEESNVFTYEGGSREIKVWNDYDPSSKQLGPMDVPNPDPGELFTEINEQLFGSSNSSLNLEPTMSGFAQNYFQFSNPADPDAVMHYYVPEQLPILSKLAKDYAVCDAWFASAPCQTWPNRFFLHAATAGGYENNSPPHFPYLMPTIFTRFNKLGLENGWKIYYHDFPHAATLSDLWPHTDQFHHFYRFKEDAVKGTLPSYSFIEPRYYTDVDFPNDQHPPHDVSLGEALIADIYNTLQSSPNWKNTLLIITYDEHGGCYDHMAPPEAIPPEAPSLNQPFAFDRYGVRVPAVVISPYIKSGTVFRAQVDSQPFDHTSIIATLRRCFDLGDSLTKRDFEAPDLLSLLTLSEDELNIGVQLSMPSVKSPLDMFLEVPERLMHNLSDLQKSLHVAAAHLPGLKGLTSFFERNEEVKLTDENLAKTGGVNPPIYVTLKEAIPYIQGKLSDFLSRLVEK